MSNALLQKLKKNSVIKETEILANSTLLEKGNVTTFVPAINIALSGTLNEGLESGLTIWAGPSRHFKTLFSLVMVKAFLDSDPEAVCLFYDSEFGASKRYFASVGIDPSRVLFTPILNIENLKFDCMRQLEELDRKDKVIILVDSLGNLASKKEVEDALSEKSVADMSRAKQIKSFFRMVTPYLSIKDIPMVCVNHTYLTQEMYAKTIMSGGQGPMLSADSVFVLGRQQGEKEDGELQGYNFVINVEKSRRVREKSKIVVEVTWKGGINRWSGLLDIALESGHVIKPNNGWYQKVDMETGEVLDGKVRKADTNTEAFWRSILASPSFQEFVRQKYQVSHNSLLGDEDDINEVLGQIEEEDE